MSDMNRSQQVFMALATVVAVVGASLGHWVSARRQEEEIQRVDEQIRRSRAEHERLDGELEAVQRRLGCKGRVEMGMCMDPPCVDSDASGATDPRYVRGSVTFYEPMGVHQTVDDTCVGPSDLREGTCKVAEDGGVAHPEWVVIHCDKGCRDGACVR